MSPVKDPTYLNERLAAMRITPELNSFTRVWHTPVGEKDENGNDVPFTQEEVMPFFDANEFGDIIINYFDLNGNTYKYKTDDATRKAFTRKRWRFPKGPNKYHQAKSSGQFPFFPPNIIQQYQVAKATGEPSIETLIITEGEFKAFVGAMAGLHIVGVLGIHGFYNGDVRGRMNEDIQELIITTKPRNILFLIDADFLTINWEANKDLIKRPESFFTAIKLFRESLEPLISDKKIVEKVAFAHLQTKFINDAKGLDDLLIKYDAVTPEIISDLLEFQFARKYFSGKLLNDLNKDIAALRKYMGLTNEQDFYNCYKDFIGNKEFLLKGKRFEYNAEKSEVQFVRHEDSDKYMRVGSDWIKLVKRADKFGKMHEELKPWSIAEINRDYKIGKNADFFINQLQKYDDFCNEPNWNGEYKRVHNGCYNLCAPLTWDKQEGSFINTYNLLKHLFQGQGFCEFDADGKFKKEHAKIGDPFTLILDWLTILLKHPKHMLPVPILVSKENGTGKSTFLKWLNIIFGTNMVILGNDQFKMKFNGHYITKFIIAIDEGFLDVDKKAEKERLKQLVTADVAYLENKGMNVTKINFYGKLVICSNDADRVMKIDEGESRWFIVKVPVVPPKKLTGAQLLAEGYTKFNDKEIDPEKIYDVPNVDPDLEKKMEAEVPSILHFLFDRQIKHPRKNRLWFDPEWFITDQMKLIVETTKNRVDRVFEDWLKEQFMTYRLPVLRYPLTHLTEVFNDPKNSKYRIDAIELKAYLADRKKLHAKEPQRIRIPIGYNLPDDPGMEATIVYKQVLARPFEFIAQDWLDTNDINELETWNKKNEVPIPKPQIVEQEELPF
jgi:hypothetical protein